MTKKFSISVSDLTYDSYLKEIRGNRSEYIEKLIILGSENLINEQTTDKSRLMKLIQEKTNIERELEQLKLQNANLKARLDKNKDVMSEEDELNTKKVRAMIRAGFLHGDD